MRLGYARVSTHEQNTDLQLDALTQAKCDKVYVDKVSGTQEQRVEFDRLMEHVRAGDVVVVWKLDRLGRSLKHLLSIVDDFKNKGVGFQSLTEGFDTTTNGGKLVFSIFGALAEYERSIIVERTKAGLQSARARGRLGGRPFSLDEKQVETAKRLYETDMPISDICKTLSISRATFYRYVKGGK